MHKHISNVFSQGRFVLRTMSGGCWRLLYTYSVMSGSEVTKGLHACMRFVGICKYSDMAYTTTSRIIAQPLLSFVLNKHIFCAWSHPGLLQRLCTCSKMCTHFKYIPTQYDPGRQKRILKYDPLISMKCQEFEYNQCKYTEMEKHTLHAATCTS